MSSLSRRALLKSALATSVLSPLLLKELERPAYAAGLPKAIFIYVPQGYMRTPDGRDNWHPQGNGTNFTLAELTQPLEPVKGDCIFFRGINGPGNHGAERVELRGGRYNGPSLDRHLGRTFPTEGGFANYVMGLYASYASGGGYSEYLVSSLDDGSPAIPRENPEQVFRDFFGQGGGSSSGPAPDTGNAQRLALQRKSVIDQVLSDTQALSQRLGPTQKQKLDLHLTSLRELEKRIAAQSAPPPPAAMCKPPTLAGGAATRALSLREMKTTSDLMNDLAVAALACHKTRFLSMQWFRSDDNTTQNGVTDLEPALGAGVSQFFHYCAHNTGDYNPRGRVDFTAWKQFFNRQVASLLQKLKTTPDAGGGSLLDNTVVYLFSETANCIDHRGDNMPYVVAGGRGLGLKTGRVLDYTGRGATHAHMIQGLARVIGGNGFALPGLDAGGGLDLGRDMLAT